MSELETVEINTHPINNINADINANGNVDACVIWLHGLGADGHDFESIVPELRLPPSYKVRFIFPHAPYRQITINNGMSMRAWYDIYSFDFQRGEDVEGIRQSARQIRELIEQEHLRGIAYERIVLAGFSQGGAMALYTGLRLPKRLAGILALSCYFPLVTTFMSEASEANKITPIMIAHGISDPLVPLFLGNATQAFLKKQNYQVEWHTYPMLHAVCLEEIEDVSRWLQRVLANVMV